MKQKVDKKNKRHLNKKRFLGFLFIIGLIASGIMVILNIRVKNVIIIGNNYVSDATIIRKGNLRDYPLFRDVSSKTLQQELNEIPLIEVNKIVKYPNGILKIVVDEEKPLAYIISNEEILTSKNNIYKDIDLKVASMPTIRTILSNDASLNLVKALNKIDDNIRQMVSEIEYSPTISSSGKVIDDKRFTFYMNDGNIAIINTINIDKFNDYLEVVSKTYDSFGHVVTGTYNFDSGTSNVVFQENESSSGSGE